MPDPLRRVRRMRAVAVPGALPGAVPGALPGAVAVALGVAFLLAPPMGTDLSAQVARADFFAAHGWAPLDFGWYGGVSPHGYSLVTPPLMAWLGGGLLGPRLVGVLAAVLSTVAFALLLRRTAAARPVLGATVGAACFYGNLVSGRVTYALGVAAGLLALLALTSRRRWLRAGGALGGAALAAATSPVAGLFVGLAGAAWALSAPWSTLAGGLSARAAAGADGAAASYRPGRTDGAGAQTGQVDRPVGAAGPAAVGAQTRQVDRVPRASRLAGGALLMVGAAGPMAVMAGLFGAGGWMNISAWDTTRAVASGLVVALLVSRPAVRLGALLSSAGVLAAYAVHTPVGLNATRLAAMFTLPVLCSYADVAWLRPAKRALAAAALAVVLAAVAAWQPPVMVADLRAAGDPAADPAYFAPLRDELARRAPVGRVEVVPLANYWDAAYVPPAAPLARGWLRQADLAHNADLFFDGRLDAGEYESWLRDNGVSYVALADAEPSWVGRAEAALVRGGLPYLREAWRGGHWTLYEVSGAPSVGSGARLVSSTPAGVTLEVSTPGEVLVRVRWSRWLAVRGPRLDCLRPAGEWVAFTAFEPGRYELTGAFTDRGPFCTPNVVPVSHGWPIGALAGPARLAGWGP